MEPTWQFRAQILGFIKVIALDVLKSLVPLLTGAAAKSSWQCLKGYSAFKAMSKV